MSKRRDPIKSHEAGIHLHDTPYGFEYGAADVERVHHFRDPKNLGKVVIGVYTPRAELQIVVTKSGMVRIFVTGKHGVVRMYDKETRTEWRPEDEQAT